MSDTTSVVKELECPVCLQYMTGAISLCESGHSICKNCRDGLPISKCPLCSKEFVAERNLALEKISSIIKYPCRNCRKLFEFKDIEPHEKSCEYGCFRCPLYFLQCGWQKKITLMKEHIKCIHKKYIHNWMVYKDINLYVTFFNQETFVIFGFNENEHIRQYSAMYVGPVKHAKNYFIKMDFADQSTKGFALSVSAPCIPQCKIEDVFKYDKISISRGMLNYFKAKTGKFVSDIAIMIKK